MKISMRMSFKIIINRCDWWFFVNYIWYLICLKHMVWIKVEKLCIDNQF